MTTFPSFARRPLNVRLAALAFTLLLASPFLRAADTPPAASSEKPIARFAIGAEAGTAGYGPVIVFTASRHLTATLGYTFFNYDRDVNTSDGDFHGKLKLSNLQAMLNWHPMAGTFHLSAGLVLTDNKIDVTGQPRVNATYTIGDTTYTTTQIGNLTGDIKISKGAAPYVGLGWAKRPAASGFSVFFDIGVIFMSSPNATLHVTGPIASDPTFQSNLRKEEQKLNDEVDAVRYYPALQLGLMYRF